MVVSIVVSNTDCINYSVTIRIIPERIYLKLIVFSLCEAVDSIHSLVFVETECLSDEVGGIGVELYLEAVIRRSIHVSDYVDFVI